MKLIVVDTNVLLNRFEKIERKEKKNKIIVPKQVFEEVKRFYFSARGFIPKDDWPLNQARKVFPRLEAKIRTGKWEVRDVESLDAIGKVRGVMVRQRKNLSLADIAIAALAFELRRRYKDVTVWTDDRDLRGILIQLGVKCK